MKFFMRSFGQTQLYSNGIHINQFFMKRFGHTQLYSNEFLY